jgi:hypothetical protein
LKHVEYCSRQNKITKKPSIIACELTVPPLSSSAITNAASRSATLGVFPFAFFESYIDDGGRSGARDRKV